MKHNVYLAQVNNRFGNAVFLPYSVGLLQAYAQTFPEIREAYDFKGFLVERDPIEVTLDALSEAHPDVLGLSCYIWNFEYNVALARAVKEHFPECFIIAGGPHIPSLPPTDYFERYPFDFVVHNEGEVAFVDVLLARKRGADLKIIPGTTANHGPRVAGGERLKDLRVLPSPYLSGVFDRLVINDDVEWVMSQETHRGCPYSCFTGRTKIITSRGTNRPAKSIQIGDHLAAFDEKTKRIVETTVVRVFEHEARDILKLTFEGGRTLEVTAEHPLYVGGVWRRVEDLCVGDEVYDITFKDKIALQKRLDNPMKRPEVRRRVSDAVKELFRTGALDVPHLRAGQRGKVDASLKRYWASSRSKKQRTASSLRMRRANPMRVAAYRAKASATQRERIASGEIVPFMCTPEYWEKVAFSPNRQEQALSALLEEEFGERYRFVGDGAFKVGYYSPDFVDEEHKKIIEYYGCWWHGCSRCFPEKGTSKRDADRMRKFRAAGYKVRVIWSHQMGDIDQLLRELRVFTYNGAKIVAIEPLGRAEKVFNFQCAPYDNYFANYLLAHNCTFCDWGSAVFQKVRQFDDDRVIREMQWAADNKIELLYNCDANYGLFERDLELTRSMTLIKGQYGYPRQFRAAYAKNSNKRVFDIAKTLHDADMCKGVTLSFQSLHEPVLSLIKRKNMKMNNFQELISQYTEAGIPTYTEMILGLPGETYDSFADGINTLLEAGQHDSINVYPCMVLPNAEMANPRYRAAHGIKTVVIPDLATHSVPAEDPYQETKEIVVGTAIMPTEDWQKAYTFSCFVQAFHSMGLLQEVAKWMRKERGWTYRVFYEELVRTFELTAAIATDATRRVLAGGAWDLVLPQYGEISWTPEEAVFLSWIPRHSELLTHHVKKGFNLPDELLSAQTEAVIQPHDEPYCGDLKRYAREIVWYGRKASKWRKTP